MIYAFWQTVWTLIRLLVMEQSDLGPHAFVISAFKEKNSTRPCRQSYSILEAEHCVDYEFNREAIIIHVGAWSRENLFMTVSCIRSRVFAQSYHRHWCSRDRCQEYTSYTCYTHSNFNLLAGLCSYLFTSG